MASVHVIRATLALALLALSVPASAQGLLPASSGALRLELESGTGETVVPAPPPPPAPTQSWVDVARVIDGLRIPEKIADLRAVTADASGKNLGFYFASNSKGVFSVYRNARLMQKGVIENVYDLQEPAVFRMTGSGDLLYALHGTDLYVNQTSVSRDLYSFAKGVDSVHEEGGVLTFPEGGDIVRYDIARDRRSILFRHLGSIEYMRRKGDTIAYTLRERGFVRMYRDGRRVSTKAVDNPENFAIGKEGEVYYFTKAPRGYALYRDARAYVTDKGNGAYVEVDPDGHVWHYAYVRLDRRTTVSLRRDRSSDNLLPKDAVNVELDLTFPGDGGFAGRVAFAKEPTHFWLVRDGQALGQPFLFEYPLNDMHGMDVLGDAIVLRAFDDSRWRILMDGEKVTHAKYRKAWFHSVNGNELTIYATR